MTTQDVLNIAGTVLAIATTIVVIYRLYTMVKDEAARAPSAPHGCSPTPRWPIGAAEAPQD